MILILPKLFSEDRFLLSIFLVKFFFMNDSSLKKFKNIIEVKTRHIVAEAGHPRVFYEIKPSIGYVVCNYTNTCFKLSEDADLKSEELFVYRG